MHIQWIRGLKFEHEAEQLTFGEYLLQVEHLVERLKALDEKIEAISKHEPFKEAVGWLRCFCGIDTLSAMIIISEIHDFRRFDSAPQLMKYIGLTPSEHSSGESQRKGGITKLGFIWGMMKLQAI